MDGEALLAQASAALPSTVPPSIREDVLNEIVLAILSGKELTPDVVRSCVQEVTRNTFSPWGVMSLDAPLPGHAEDEGAASLGDFLSGDSVTGTVYGRVSGPRKTKVKVARLRGEARRDWKRRYQRELYRRHRYSPQAIGDLYSELDRQAAAIAAALGTSKKEALRVTDETEGYEYRQRALRAQRIQHDKRGRHRRYQRKRSALLTVHHAAPVHAECHILPSHFCRCACLACSERRRRSARTLFRKIRQLTKRLEEQVA